MKFDRLIPLAALAALLAACGDDGAPQEGEVTGEVLQGSISDEMLPLDQVRSEAPLADPTAAARGDGSPTSDAGEPLGETPAEPEDPSPAEPAEAEDES